MKDKMDTYRKEMLHCRTDSNLRFGLLMADYISRYEKGKLFSEPQMTVFNGLVERIIKERPDLNELPDEEIGRLFGTVKYEEQTALKDLAYYQVGKMLSENSDCHTLPYLDFADENMEHGFYYGFAPSHDVLKSLLDEVKNKGDMVVMEARMMNERPKDFYQFCKYQLKDQLSDDEIIATANIYNNGDYTEVPGYVSVLGHLMLRQEEIELWAELLCTLKYYPLQGALLHQLHTTDLCMKVWDVLKAKQSTRWKVLAWLMRSRMSRLLVQEWEYLERNAENEDISESDLALAHNELGAWRANIEGRIKTMVVEWTTVFGNAEMSEWYSGKQARVKNIARRFAEYEQRVINIIGEMLSSSITIDEGMIDGKDLNTLLYYASLIESGKADKKLSVKLIQTICHQIYHQQYVPELKLSEESLTMLRSIYRCLLWSGENGYKLMHNERYADDGRIEGYSIDYHITRGDAFWLSVLILASEEIEENKWFQEALRYLNIVNDGGFNQENFFTPYYLAEMIVSQVLTSEKDDYERMLIYYMNNLPMVLRILSANNGVMSNDNKALLGARVKREWELEKQLSSQRHQPHQDFLEDYLKKVL